MCDIDMLYCKISVRLEDISDTAKLQLTQLTLTVRHHQNWQFVFYGILHYSLLIIFPCISINVPSQPYLLYYSLLL